MRKVVVTGIGMLTGLGETLKENWLKIKKGEQHLKMLNYITNGNDPSIEYALQTTKYALKDAGLDLNNYDRTRIGCFVSSSKGGMVTFWNKEKNISKDFLQNFLSSSVGSFISSTFGIKGPVLNLVGACATGVQSILFATNFIKRGDSDLAIAGSSEASSIPLILSGFNNMGVLTKNKMRPYDKDRDGFVVGEGCGIIILESEEMALRRNAHIYCYVKGGCLTNDATHITSFNDNAESISLAISKALGNAGVSAEEIDYINSHGTATKVNDVIETKAIKRSFHKFAKKVSISSTKPITGHLLGAASSVEFIISILAMKNSFIPPTINLENPDEECDLDYTPNIGKSKIIRNFMSLSFGFGGHIGIIIGGK
ncbi:MAG: beta-ketoacyl-[acyl-carrier-protein] synthase family protein [Candidatus Firestonebacteria bacterium]